MQRAKKVSAACDEGRDFSLTRRSLPLLSPPPQFFLRLGASVVSTY